MAESVTANVSKGVKKALAFMVVSKQNVVCDRPRHKRVSEGGESAGGRRMLDCTPPYLCHIDGVVEVMIWNLVHRHGFAYTLHKAKERLGRDREHLWCTQT